MLGENGSSDQTHAQLTQERENATCKYVVYES